MRVGERSVPGVRAGRSESAGTAGGAARGLAVLALRAAGAESRDELDWLEGSRTRQSAGWC